MKVTDEIEAVHHMIGATPGSLRIEVWNGRGLFALGENLTTEEAREFCQRLFGRRP